MVTVSNEALMISILDGERQRLAARMRKLQRDAESIRDERRELDVRFKTLSEKINAVMDTIHDREEIVRLNNMLTW